MSAPTAWRMRAHIERAASRLPAHRGGRVWDGALMRYGFYFPTRGPTATRDGILALAREGERLGFHPAMVADHIVLTKVPIAVRSQCVRRGSPRLTICLVIDYLYAIREG